MTQTTLLCGDDDLVVVLMVLGCLRRCRAVMHAESLARAWWLQVAHIMNNEMQRKYLTSVKRLIKFAQDKRPDVPPSKKVL